MSSSHPHDTFFKATFSDPRLAAEALRRRLPVAVAERIDWARLEPMPAEFVGEDLTGHRADLVFRAPLAGHDAFIFVLYEHQSSSDGLMAFRALVYIVRIWQSWLRQHPDARALPAVVPVVLHHGPRPWSGAVALRELIDLPPELFDALAGHLPDFEVVLDDLTRSTDAAIEASTGATIVVAALLALKNGAYLPDPLSERLMGHLSAAMQDEAGRAAVERTLRYLYTVSEFDPEQAQAKLAGSARHEQLREVIMTAADRLIEKGRAEGLEEGRAEGRATLLLQLLTLKFGRVPDAVRARVEQGDAEAVERWVERILVAPDLASVFD